MEDLVEPFQRFLGALEDDAYFQPLATRIVSQATQG